LTTSKRHPSTPHSRNTSFSQGNGPYTFPRSTKHVNTPLPGSQDFSKIFWRVVNCAVVLWVLRKPHWVSSSFASIISPYIVFNELGIHSSWEAKQRDNSVVGAFTPVSLVAFVDDQFANLSVPFQNAMTLDTHESAKSSGVASSQNSYFSQLDLSSDFATASKSLLMHSSTEAFTCATAKHPN